MQTAALLGKYPIVSDQIKAPALGVVLSECEKTIIAGIPGAVTEFGCYIGTTSMFIRRLLDLYQDGRAFHVYDSFAGLPPKAAQDMTPIGADFKAGELTVSKKQLLNEFHKAHLRAPIVHKGWFNDLQPAVIPDDIAFAFLDGDFYDSIMDSLKLVWPRMSAGGIICIDDYKREALPGVDRAVADFFRGKSVAVRVAHNIGIITNK